MRSVVRPWLAECCTFKEQTTAEIIGMRHPDTETWLAWLTVYYAITEALHFNPETI